MRSQMPTGDFEEKKAVKKGDSRWDKISGSNWSKQLCTLSTLLILLMNPHHHLNSLKLWKCNFKRLFTFYVLFYFILIERLLSEIQSFKGNQEFFANLWLIKLINDQIQSPYSRPMLAHSDEHQWHVKPSEHQGWVVLVESPWGI